MAESKNPTIGHITCPLCGEEMQDVRVNKNFNLYTFCDNGCKFNISTKVSRKIRPLLEQGQNITLEKISITSTKQKEKTNARAEQPRGNETNRRVAASEPRGLSRAEPSRPTEAGAVATGGTSPARGIWQQLLGDDDDE